VRNTWLLREPPNNGRPPESPDWHLAKPKKQAITRTRGGQEGRPSACADHAPTRRELHDPPGSQRDRRGPKTATGRFMSKKSQPRLTDLTLNTISAGHSPTPVYLLEPETKSLCLLPTKTKKTKERKTKTKQPPPVQHWEERNFWFMMLLESFI